MNFERAIEIAESLILEKRSYKHRPGYTKNKKGSYIDAGKTKWDSQAYKSGEATPGNERLVSQIQHKLLDKYDAQASRNEIKRFLKSDTSQKIYDKLKKKANSVIGSDEDDDEWRAYVFGSFADISAKIILNKKGTNKGVKYVL